jgi:aarF domain-containing kinase
MWKQTTGRVLTMEFCPGAKVTELDYLHRNGIDPYQVSNLLMKVFSEMIFLHGFIHCDPHPGNVFVHCLEPAKKRFLGLSSVPARWELVLLDHGLYREISTEFRLNYARLWMSVIAGDVPKIQQYCREIGAGDAYRLFSSVLTHRTWSSVSERVISTQTTLQEIQLIKERAPGYLVQVADFLAKIPRPLLLLLKTNDLLRAIERILHEPSDARPVQSFFITARFCADAVLIDELAHGRRHLWSSLAARLSHCLIVSKINLFEWLIRVKMFIFGKSEIM